MHRHSSCDYSSHAFAQPSGRAQTTFRSEADGENEPGHGANVGRARFKRKILTQRLGSVGYAFASAHRAIHIRGPGSRPGPRIAIGGRPLTAAVARGGAQSRSQKLALRAAPRYQHRCQNGLPWPTEVFFQEGGSACAIRGARLVFLRFDMGRRLGALGVNIFCVWALCPTACCRKGAKHSACAIRGVLLVFLLFDMGCRLGA